MRLPPPPSPFLGLTGLPVPCRAPDHFFLCCQRASTIGGESFLVDLELCLSRLPAWAADRLLGLEFERTVTLPPNYDTFALKDGLADAAADETIATGQVKQMQTAPAPTTRRDRLCTPVPEANRKLLKGNLSEFELDIVEAMRSEGPEADALVEEAVRAVYRPVPERSAEDGARDMEALTLYLREVAREEQAAERVALRPGEAIVVDNYRCDHGREGYTDLVRRHSYQYLGSGLHSSQDASDIVADRSGACGRSGAGVQKRRPSRTTLGQAAPGSHHPRQVC